MIGFDGICWSRICHKIMQTVHLSAIESHGSKAPENKGQLGSLGGDHADCFLLKQSDVEIPW